MAHPNSIFTPCQHMEPISSNFSAMLQIWIRSGNIGKVVKKMIIQNSRPCIFNASLSSFTCSWNYLPSQRICNEAAFDPWIFWHAYHSELTNLSRVTIDVLTSLKSRTKDDNGADMGISYLNFSLFGRAPLSLNVCCIHGDVIAALVERHLPCFYTSLDCARVSPGRWVCSVSC
jgi:hypothetical protein